MMAKTRLIIGILAGTVLSAPLSAQARPKMDDPPKPFLRLSTSALSIRDSIVVMAKRQLGTPYRSGQSRPGVGFDCSGLVQYVMEAFNIVLPRTSREQATVGKAVPRDLAALKPGDLLTFGKGKRISHIGIYIGDGKFVHASTGDQRVKVAALTGSSWWKGARRVVASTDSVTRQ